MMVTGFWRKNERHAETARQKAVTGLRISDGFLRNIPAGCLAAMIDNVRPTLKEGLTCIRRIATFSPLREADHDHGEAE
jgi:hypothetical protein